MIAKLHQNYKGEPHAGCNSGTDSKAARVPAYPYNELAWLVRYEHVDASLAGTPISDEQFRAAMAQLEADDRKREHPDFTLTDISGIGGGRHLR